MVDLTDAEIERAEQRGANVLASAPKAKAARYDAETGRITIELANGCAYTFPARLSEDLSGGSDEDLSIIDVDGHGLNLHWPRLDADLSVPAIVAGIFGTRAWMTRELARVAGSTKSTAKSAAARRNGLKGGRPAKRAG
jgi:hypothetical protein